MGAAAMYLMDPDSGRRRRALLRDKMVRVANVKRETLAAAGRDLRNRAKGVAARISSAFQGDSADDGRLAERVRSKIGRVVTHPGAVEVGAQGGTVTIAGDVLASEVESLVECVRAVKGVEQVDNQMAVHNSPKGVPSLQGDGKLPDSFGALDPMTPGVALVAGAVGSALAIYGISRRDLLGGAIGAVALGLVVKSLKDTEGQRLFGTRNQ